MTKSKIGIYGKDFLTLLDFSEEQILGILDLAQELKDMKKNGIPHRLCEGKNIALIFEKHSTRTFSSFNVAANDLGMSATFLTPTVLILEKKSPLQILPGFSQGCLTA